MIVLKRIFVEKRAVAIPLIVVLLVNVLVYALVVYPLARRAAGAVDHAATAAQSRPSARWALWPPRDCWSAPSPGCCRPSHSPSH